MGAGVADLGRRIVTLIRDGDFQMTAPELSTIRRQKQNPMILLMNNDGYPTERSIQEDPLQPWAYHCLLAVFGGGWGIRVTTKGDLNAALEWVRTTTNSPSLIKIMLDRLDTSGALKRLSPGLSPDRPVEQSGFNGP